MKSAKSPNRSITQARYPNAEIYGKLTAPTSRLMIGIPITGLVRVEWMVARYHQVYPTNWGTTENTVPLPTWLPLNYLVAEARNSIINAAVRNDFEWVLFIDHDTIIPPNCFVQLNKYLQEGDVPIVSGLYFTRSVPSHPLVFRGKGNGYFSDWKMGDLVWADVVPMGCTLIHGSILKVLWEESEEYFYKAQNERIRRVFNTTRNLYFDPQNLNWHTHQGTEDFDFCTRIIEDKIFAKAGWPEYQKKKHPFLIDTNIFCRHIEPNGMQFPSQGEEIPFCRCKIEGCGKDATQGINNFYWCEEHLPKRLRSKLKNGK